MFYRSKTCSHGFNNIFDNLTIVTCHMTSWILIHIGSDNGLSPPRTQCPLFVNSTLGNILQWKFIWSANVYCEITHLKMSFYSGLTVLIYYRADYYQTSILLSYFTRNVGTVINGKYLSVKLMHSGHKPGNGGGAAVSGYTFYHYRAAFWHIPTRIYHDREYICLDRLPSWRSYVTNMWIMFFTKCFTNWKCVLVSSKINTIGNTLFTVKFKDNESPSANYP